MVHATDYATQQTSGTRSCFYYWFVLARPLDTSAVHFQFTSSRCLPPPLPPPFLSPSLSSRLRMSTLGIRSARWDHLASSAPMLLSMSLAGLPFVGADVGGFFGDPSAELFLRWMQVYISDGEGNHDLKISLPPSPLFFAKCRHRSMRMFFCCCFLSIGRGCQAPVLNLHSSMMLTLSLWDPSNPCRWDHERLLRRPLNTASWPNRQALVVLMD